MTEWENAHALLAARPRAEHRLSLKRLHAGPVMLPLDLAAFAIVGLVFPQHLRAFSAAAVLTVLLFFAAGLYLSRVSLSMLDDLPAIVGRLLVATSMVSTIEALRHDRAGLESLLKGLALAGGLLIAERFAATAAIREARRRRIVEHPTVIVGCGPLAATIIRTLNSYPEHGLSAVGYVDATTSQVPDLVADRLGDLSAINRIVSQHAVEAVIVADANLTDRQLTDLVRLEISRTAHVFVVPRLRQVRTAQGAADHIGAVPIARVVRPRLDGPEWALKRVFDVVVSGLALFLLAPALLAVAAAVRLEGGPGVIFRQERISRDGQRFQVLKFRSLKPASEAESATNWNISNDHRLGRVGRFLRATSIDELPQLWNVFRGDMTIVGPRPERPHFAEQFSKEINDYVHRHRVPAGLTGLAQVHGLRGDTSIEDRARFDNYYIENWSFWLDIKVMVRTVREVLFARGS